MEKVYLSDSGPKVSPAIYGFYRWDNQLNGGATEMERIVNLCLDLGINTFDHADIYGNYQCEKLFGELLANKSFKREDVIIFTKCGLRVPNDSQPDVRLKHFDITGEHITKSVDQSLKNLKTDYIDIFLLNHFDPIADLEETAATLRRLKDAGKIKNIGVSNFSVFQHQLLASYLGMPIVTNHIELNLLNTSALDNGQIDYIKQRYMRPLASAPLAEGRIATGTDAQAVKLREKLQQIAKKYDADIESIAAAWIVKLGALPLIGTQNEGRIKNIVKAFDIDLDKQDWYDLYEVAKN
jgi:predicted oxidoreductase